MTACTPPLQPQVDACDVATFWKSENKCGLKSWALKPNITSNPDRESVNVTVAPFTPDELCAFTTGVVAVTNGTDDAGRSVLDLFLYNHATFAKPIADCNIAVDVADLVTRGPCSRRWCRCWCWCWYPGASAGRWSVAVARLEKA